MRSRVVENPVFQARADALATVRKCEAELTRLNGEIDALREQREEVKELLNAAHQQLKRAKWGKEE